MSLEECFIFIPGGKTTRFIETLAFSDHRSTGRVFKKNWGGGTSPFKGPSTPLVWLSRDTSFGFDCRIVEPYLHLLETCNLPSARSNSSATPTDLLLPCLVVGPISHMHTAV